MLQLIWYTPINAPQYDHKWAVDKRSAVSRFMLDLKSITYFNHIQPLFVDPLIRP